MNKELKELLSIIDTLEDEVENFKIIIEICENVKRLTKDFNDSQFFALISTIIAERYDYEIEISINDLLSIINKNKNQNMN